MKRLLIIIIVLIIAGVSLLSAAESEESAIKSKSLTISVKPEYTYSKFGISVKELQSISDIPTDTSETVVALRKKIGKTEGGTNYVYAASTVYLYYYYVGKDKATLTVTADKPLQILDDNNNVVASIHYYIRFANSDDEMVYPTNWDGGLFDKKRISTDQSFYSGKTAEVMLKGQKTTMMTWGIWTIVIYTGSLSGDSYTDNQDYSGSITLALKTS